jgi:pimeloyl-ACP methyl ester carboxylesterase
MTRKPSLVVVHGANGSGATMQPLSEQLESYVEVFAPDLVGQGGRQLPERFRIEETAADVITQMDARDLARTYLFGYSSGGYLALYLARHYPERFIAISGLAVKYVFDERTVAHWTHLADPKRMQERNPGRVDELIRTHHPQDWVTLLQLTNEYFRDLGRKPPLSVDDLRAIAQPVMLFSSDNDQIVPLDESTELAKLLPDSRLVMFKGQSHPFNVVPVVAIARALTTWIGELQKTSAASV